LLCFKLTLRGALYFDFGFYLSMVIPSIAYWLTLALFAFGFLKTAVLIVWRLSRRRTAIVMRDFLPYQFCLCVLHVAYAAAYSSPPGLLFCVFVFILFLFEVRSLSEVKRVRQRHPREKWE
jgi:hypothetical protein